MKGAGRTGSPRVGDVAAALGEAASQLGAFVEHMIAEEPGVALVAAGSLGFLVGRGLDSPLGARVTASTLRATLGNLTTLVALDLLRRAVDNGGACVSAEGPSR